MNYNIGIYAEKVECITYTIAYSISLGDYNIFVITGENNPKNQQHQIYLKKISELQNTRVINNCDRAINLDLMYIDFTQSISRKNVIKWSVNSKEVAAIYNFKYDSYRQNYIAQTKAIVKYFPLSLNYKNIGMLNNFYKFDPVSLLTKRYRIGFDVHSNFLQNQELSNLMFAFEWNPTDRRKYKINFLGNTEPDVRNDILRSIKKYLDLPEIIVNTQKYLPRSDTHLNWIEYDSNTSVEKRGLPAQKYMNLLSDSDFTLCPPGYISMTHRVIEALIRGSIPILNKHELKLYDINLQHEINCIAVENNNWVAAIKKIFTIKRSKIIEMRSNILEMKDNFLLPEVTAKRLRQKMGLN